MRKLRRLISFICFLPLLAGLSANVWGAVICHGQDGHVALELSVKGECSEQLVKDSHESHKAETCDCGSCNDYSLTLSAVRTDEGITPTLFLEHENSNTLFASIPFAIDWLTKSPSYKIPLQDYPKGSHLVFLRSTVLLI